MYALRAIVLVLVLVIVLVIEPHPSRLTHLRFP
jgi:hypothetical protein